MSTNRLCLGLLGGMGGPLMSTTNPPQTKSAGSIPGHIAQLLESLVWRCVTHVHTCSKCVAHAGGFYKIHYINALLNLYAL